MIGLYENDETIDTVTICEKLTKDKKGELITALFPTENDEQE